MENLRCLNFAVFLQIFNVHEDYQVRVTRKTLTLLKQEDIILKSMTQIREKWDSLVLSRGNF